MTFVCRLVGELRIRTMVPLRQSDLFLPEGAQGRPGRQGHGQLSHGALQGRPGRPAGKVSTLA